MLQFEISGRSIVNLGPNAQARGLKRINAKMVGVVIERQPFAYLYFEYNSTINCSLIFSGIWSRCG